MQLAVTIASATESMAYSLTFVSAEVLMQPAGNNMAIAVLVLQHRGSWQH